jgi:hypothetical protein
MMPRRSLLHLLDYSFHVVCLLLLIEAHTAGILAGSALMVGLTAGAAAGTALKDKQEHGLWVLVSSPLEDILGYSANNGRAVHSRAVVLGLQWGLEDQADWKWEAASCACQDHDTAQIKLVKHLGLLCHNCPVAAVGAQRAQHAQAST